MITFESIRQRDDFFQQISACITKEINGDRFKIDYDSSGEILELNKLSRDLDEGFLEVEVYQRDPYTFSVECRYTPYLKDLKSTTIRLEPEDDKWKNHTETIGKQMDDFVAELKGTKNE